MAQGEGEPRHHGSTLWLVFTKPVEGREEEFGRWYDEVHLPDLARVPGIAGAQRFKIGPERRSPDDEPSHRFLAVYEIDGDPPEVFAEVSRRIASGDMQISDALDRGTTDQSVWHPLGPRLS